MKYFSEKEIIKQGWANQAQINRMSGNTINVRFCRDCPLFDINGIQPDPGIIHGRCLRFSDENVPYYVRVDDTDFCNEDDIIEEEH